MYQHDIKFKNISVNNNFYVSFQAIRIIRDIEYTPVEGIHLPRISTFLTAVVYNHKDHAKANNLKDLYLDNINKVSQKIKTTMNLKSQVWEIV